MKTCPICKATAFDDAEVCYGCLYRFERGGDPAPLERDGAASVIVEADESYVSPKVLITMQPVRKGGRVAWECSVEPAI